MGRFVFSSCKWSASSNDSIGSDEDVSGSEAEEQPMLSTKASSITSDLSFKSGASFEAEGQAQRCPGLRGGLCFFAFSLIGLVAVCTSYHHLWLRSETSPTSLRDPPFPYNSRNSTRHRQFDEHIKKFIAVLNRSRSLGRAPHADHIARLMNSSQESIHPIYATIASEAPQIQTRIENNPLVADVVSSEQGGSSEEVFSPQTGGEGPEEAGFRRTFYGSQCGTTLDQNVVAISLAGLSLEQSRRTCDEYNQTGHSTWDATECATDITNIFTQLAWMASFLSLVPSWCSQRDLAHQACASDWAYAEANPLQALTDILAAQNDCGPGPEPPPPVRRLQTEDIAERRQEIGLCVVSVNELAALSNQLSFNSWSTSRTCHELDMQRADQLACSSGVLNVVGLAGVIAKDIALIVGACPNKTLPGAFCGADLAELAAAIVNFGTWATAFTEDCGWTHN